MVYITSDLFGPNTPHERQYDESPNYWHAMAHEQHAAGLGKRKRMAGDDGPQQYVHALCTQPSPDTNKTPAACHANIAHHQVARPTAYTSTIPRLSKATTTYLTPSSHQNNTNTHRNDDQLSSSNVSFQKCPSSSRHHTSWTLTLTLHRPAKANHMPFATCDPVTPATKRLSDGKTWRTTWTAGGAKAGHASFVRGNV
jgi:hypothetical protein